MNSARYLLVSKIQNLFYKLVLSPFENRVEILPKMKLLNSNIYLNKLAWFSQAPAEK